MFVSELQNALDQYHLLKHPFYNRWNEGVLTRDIIKDYESNYSKINFEIDFDDEVLNLNIDKSQISRVLQNLIINSIHSIDEKGNSKGNISIKLYAANNYFNIKILDNGVGLKFEKDEIIKPYFTTKKSKGGSGLGLAIVEKILFDHNADFSIENRDDGIEGAKVLIKFDLKL